MDIRSWINIKNAAEGRKTAGSETEQPKKPSGAEGETFRATGGFLWGRAKKHERKARKENGTRRPFFVLTIGLALGISLLLSRVDNDNNPFAMAVFILAVAVVARLTDGYFWGICASVAGTLCVNYFFSYPFWSFDINYPGYPLTMTIMLIVSVLISTLNDGADDYITKPFGTEELLARIRTALRHTRTTAENDEIALNGVYHVGGLEIDFKRMRVLRDGSEVHLTPNEYRIVALLARHAGRVMTYRSMMRELWGPAASPDNKILRVHVASIRRKLEPDPNEPRYIFTEVGVGYRMAENSDSPSGREGDNTDV